jgi:hypothetical protein
MIVNGTKDVLFEHRRDHHERGFLGCPAHRPQINFWLNVRPTSERPRLIFLFDLRPKDYLFPTHCLLLKTADYLAAEFGPFLSAGERFTKSSLDLEIL